jgi:protein-tyrosine phosphatase
LYTGAEVHISHNLIEEIKNNRANMVINDSQYLLVEFPMSHIFSGIKELFFDLMSEGIVPIIAHPERNVVFMENPSFLYDLLRMGVLSQANSGSFLSFYGRRVAEAANRFLSWNYIHFLGSDSHNDRSMAPQLSEAVFLLENRIGKDAARTVVWDNPQAVLDNEDIIVHPEPVNPEKDSKSFKIHLPIFNKKK